MSILLIGQKILPPPQKYQLQTHKQFEGSREDKIRQMKYRMQLQQQIEYNRQRRAKEKQRQIILDRQRQLAVLKEVYKRYQKHGMEPKQWFGHKSFFDREFQDHRINFLQNTKDNLILPSLYHKSFNRHSEYLKPLSKPKQASNKLNYHKPRKIKTQNSIYQPQYNESQIFYNPEKRDIIVRNNQNRKFRQFYELLDESKDDMQEEIPKPIKKEKSYRLKKLNQKLKNNKFTLSNIVEEQSQFSELPYWSTKKPIKRFYEQDNQWHDFQTKERHPYFQQYPKRYRPNNEYSNRLKGLHKRILSKIDQ